MVPRKVDGEWFIEVEAEGLGKVLLLKEEESLPIAMSFATKEEAEAHIQRVRFQNSIIDKAKLTKWIEEEIYGCNQRRESEREWAMRELLLKIERGYFDIESPKIASGKKSNARYDSTVQLGNNQFTHASFK